MCLRGKNIQYLSVAMNNANVQLDTLFQPQVYKMIWITVQMAKLNNL